MSCNGFDMNILYIGRFFTKGLINSALANNVGMSNHNFEMSIINGFCQCEKINLSCLTIPAVYSYPYNNKQIYTKRETYNYNGSRVCSVGFCNLPILKEIWSTIALSVQIVEAVSRFSGDKVHIIINTASNNLMNALRIAKLFTNKKLSQTVIIPDIPAMVSAMDGNNRLKEFALKYRNRRAMDMLSQSNGLVLLTEAMKDFVNKSIPYVVMEGIVDVESMDVTTANELHSDKEVILYTGSLRKIFGVMNLVHAFQMLKDVNAELWICGSGDSKNAIENAAKEDSRIKFWGLVDSETALKKQRQATILVNPRTSEGEYTKYSFPSKTMEYLLSAKSVIINRLEGIPEEYYRYVYVPENESVAALAECIRHVLEMNHEQRAIKAMEGREFVIKKKNSKVQTSRIIEMISKY
jgi:glycosyltransferase involved in cell wall biosynthesis